MKKHTWTKALFVMAGLLSSAKACQEPYNPPKAPDPMSASSYLLTPWEEEQPLPKATQEAHTPSANGSIHSALQQRLLAHRDREEDTRVLFVELMTWLKARPALLGERFVYEHEEPPQELAMLLIGWVEKSWAFTQEEHCFFLALEKIAPQAGLRKELFAELFSESLDAKKLHIAAWVLAAFPSDLQAQSLREFFQEALSWGEPEALYWGAKRYPMLLKQVPQDEARSWLEELLNEEYPGALGEEHMKACLAWLQSHFPKALEKKHLWQAACLPYSSTLQLCLQWYKAGHPQEDLSLFCDQEGNTLLHSIALMVVKKKRLSLHCTKHITCLVQEGGCNPLLPNKKGKLPLDLLSESRALLPVRYALRKVMVQHYIYNLQTAWETSCKGLWLHLEQEPALLEEPFALNKSLSRPKKTLLHLLVEDCSPQIFQADRKKSWRQVAAYLQDNQAGRELLVQVLPSIMGKGHCDALEVLNKEAERLLAQEHIADELLTLLLNHRFAPQDRPRHEARRRRCLAWLKKYAPKVMQGMTLLQAAYFTELSTFQYCMEWYEETHPNEKSCLMPDQASLSYAAYQETLQQAYLQAGALTPDPATCSKLSFPTLEELLPGSRCPSAQLAPSPPPPTAKPFEKLEKSLSTSIESHPTSPKVGRPSLALVLFLTLGGGLLWIMDVKAEQETPPPTSGQGDSPSQVVEQPAQLPQPLEPTKPSQEAPASCPRPEEKKTAQLPMLALRTQEQGGWEEKTCGLFLFI